VRHWLFDMQEKFLMNKEKLTDQEKEILRMMDSLIPKEWY
jgi:DNA-binding CsgD family transcriptional regulator